jgi:hypothetical protein
MSQLPLPGQSTLQLPWQWMSQSPDPVQLTVLKAPTSIRHCPLLAHQTAQPSPQMKAQFPDPAHCRSQSPLQSMLQSPDAGQTQLEPEHSQCPSSHDVRGPPHPDSITANPTETSKYTVRAMPEASAEIGHVVKPGAPHQSLHGARRQKPSKQDFSSNRPEIQTQIFA